MTGGSDFHELGGVTGRRTEGLHAAEYPGDYEIYGYSVAGIIECLDNALAERRAGISPVA